MRVMTWNLWWRFGDWAGRRHAILAELREVDADLIGLQEVWALGEENLAEWLAGELGLHWAYAPTAHPEQMRKRLGADPVDFGVAVLSRWPLAREEPLELVGEPGRTLLAVDVEAPHATVPFLTAHLTATGPSSARQAQVRQICEVVARRRHPTHPSLVTGDFNALPESDEMRLIGGYLTDPPVPDLVLMDCWLFAEPGDTGLTWNRRNPLMATGPEPSARIDYILAEPRRQQAGRVLSARMAGSRPHQGVWPSDHFAVVVELSD